MIIRRLASLAIGVALAAVLPLGAFAQDETGSPQGQDWILASYADTDELTPVPFGVTATLRLDDGNASGSGGCNSFSGSYELEGQWLTFGDEFVTTVMACAGPAGALEDAYLPLLPRVSMWSVAGDELTLADAFGEALLIYQLPGVTLTQSQFDVLVAEVARLRAEVDELRGEAAPATSPAPTTSPAPAGSPTPEVSPTPVAFSSAERVLLEGVATRIAKTCEPLRRNLPEGAVAAVACSPSADTVRRVSYYLMDQDSAAEWFSRRMSRNGVRGVNDVGGQCRDGFLAGSDGPGPGSYAQGCFIDGNGNANVHYLQTPTECKVLRAGGQRLETPVIYVAVIGEGDDVQGLTRWTERGTPAYSGRYNQISGLTREIERPNANWSPGCPVYSTPG